MDVYSSSNSTRPIQLAAWMMRARGSGSQLMSATPIAESRMFGHVRSDGGSSGEGVGARRRSTTLPGRQNGGYTSRVNRTVERRLSAHTGRRRNGGFLMEQTMEFFGG
ncbi:hypothetical protein S83_006105 [Arachis hypogaea]